MHSVLRPEPLDEPDPFFEPRGALLEGNPEGVEFLLHVPQTQTQDEPPIRHHIQEGRVLRHMNRMIQGEEENARSKLDGLRPLRKTGEGHEGRAPRRRVGPEMVLGEEHDVESQAFGKPGVFQKMIEAAVPLIRCDGEFHEIPFPCAHTMSGQR